MRRKFGIIGYPLSHSFSPSFFNKKFSDEHISAEYNLYPLTSIEQIKQLVEEQNLDGLNVTIPYKRSVIPYLTSIDDAADEIGAVNCIAIDGMSVKGFNTDHIGFSESLKPYLESHHIKALILGTGGASQAVMYALNKLGIGFQSVSRHKNDDSITYDELTPGIIDSHTIIVNTTPLGMFPDINEFPSIPYGAISDKHLLFDLIYNPQETIFLQKGKSQGATCLNGYEMLIIQAQESWKIWNS